MKAIVLGAALAASLALGSTAFAAAPATVEGMIKSLDVKADTLTLNTGAVFHLGKSVKLASLKAGEKVKITFKKVGNADEATAVVVE